MANSGLLLIQNEGSWAVSPLLSSHGFLPTRGSLMLDIVVCAMLLVMMILAVSIYLVRQKRLYFAHRTIQIGLASLLAIAIVGFEIDIRFFTDWRVAAEESPFYANGWVDRVLWIHLAFAIPTPFVWAFVLFGAVRNFNVAEPGEYSRFHRRWGWIASVFMLLTTVTGWGFYYLAFVA